MTTFLLLGFTALMLTVWVRARWVQPLRHLRSALAVLADDALDVEVKPAESDDATADHLRRIAGRLRGADARASEESLNLQAVLGSLSEGVLIVDVDEKIRLANRGVQAMLGLAQPPLHRTLLEILRHHEVRDATRRTLDFCESCALPLTLTVRSADGKYVTRHFHVTTAPIAPVGAQRPIGAIAVLHDITQLKSLENVRRDFVANVSHELRTPLSIINGYLETLLEPDADTDPTIVRGFHETMWKHGQRLRLILDDLMTLARLESPEAAAAIRLGPVSLKACIDAVVDRILPVAEERHGSVRVEVPDDLPSLDADADQLDQVFFNLIDNALRHAIPPARQGCGGGGDPLVVTVRAMPPVPGGHTLHVTVADNGQGIPLTDQPHVFERFYRVHKDRFRQSGGTGLGLSIVKHIVRAHGGQVSVESVPGSGATFHLDLPLTQATNPPPALPVTSDPAGTS